MKSKKRITVLLSLLVLITISAMWLKVFRQKELAPDVPEQINIKPVFLKEVNGKKVYGIAKYKVKALVYGRQNYLRDNVSDISPMDLVLGWGKMSDPEIKQFFKTDQMNRCYILLLTSFHNRPMESNEAMLFLANTHIIPATDKELKTISRIREGQVVDLSGYLVLVKYKGRTVWKSSLTRTDILDGSCEILYVNSCKIVKQADE